MIIITRPLPRPASPSVGLLVAILALLSGRPSHGFSSPPTVLARQPFSCRNARCPSNDNDSKINNSISPSSRVTTTLGRALEASPSRGERGGESSSPVEITFPTPDDAASMGVRDWPQQYHSTTWTDDVPEGGIATRYVLEGRGRVTIDYYDDDNVRRRVDGRRVYPGTLVEVDGEASLLWEVDDQDGGMVILTPGYEEGGTLALVGAFFVVFCAGLIVGST